LIVRAFQVSVPVLVIVALSQTEWSSIGFVPIRWFPDILYGLGIWFTATLAFYVVAMLLPPSAFQWSESATQYERPSHWLAYCLLAAGSCANGFAEELVIRGYLLTRIERLLRSTWAALLITSVFFASYHIYQGVGSAVGIAALGLVYGAAYCFLRRLWPIVVAHAVADFTGWLASYA
jgi:membrane protease YdiL (CAAX protease family)